MLMTAANDAFPFEAGCLKSILLVLAVCKLPLNGGNREV